MTPQQATNGGGDPATDAMTYNPLEALLPPEKFFGHVARVANIQMPLSHPPSPTNDSWTDDPKALAPVSILEHFPISTHRIPLRQDSFDIRVG
jgi:hypothetical protein